MASATEPRLPQRVWVDAPAQSYHGWCTLADPIGEGGEAVVYRVAEQPEVAIKVYRNPTPERAQKLTVMVAAPPNDPTRESHKHVSIAWPTGLAYEGTQRLRVLGFAMPRVGSMVRLHEVTSPQRRALACPGFTLRHLVRIAANLSFAVHAVHRRGHVVGDLNDANVLVRQNALVTLVDTDSFQVRDQSAAGRIIRSPVGREEFTPPELQGVDFGATDREPAHDAFALAVLVFQLLRDGQHPFAVAGAPEALRTPGACIRRGLYPYVPKRLAAYGPPLYALPIEVLDPEVVNAFFQAFHTGHEDRSARPTARDWIQILQRAEANLRSCSEQPQRHVYGGHLRACPWCQVEAVRGRVRARQETNAPVAPLAPRASHLQVLAATPVAPAPARKPGVAASLDPGVRQAAGASLFERPPSVKGTASRGRPRQIATVSRVAHRFTGSAGEEVRVSLLHLDRVAHLDVRAYPRSADGTQQPAEDGLTLPLTMVSKLLWAIDAAAVLGPRSITVAPERVVRVGLETYQGAPVLDIRLFERKQPTSNALVLWAPKIPELRTGLEALS